MKAPKGCRFGLSLGGLGLKEQAGKAGLGFFFSLELRVKIAFQSVNLDFIKILVQLSLRIICTLRISKKKCNAKKKGSLKMLLTNSLSAEMFLLHYSIIYNTLSTTCGRVHITAEQTSVWIQAELSH